MRNPERGSKNMCHSRSRRDLAVWKRRSNTDEGGGKLDCVDGKGKHDGIAAS